LENDPNLIEMMRVLVNNPIEIQGEISGSELIQLKGIPEPKNP
jgi:hypothetical protein